MDFQGSHNYLKKISPGRATTFEHRFHTLTLFCEGHFHTFHAFFVDFRVVLFLSPWSLRLRPGWDLLGICLGPSWDLPGTCLGPLPGTCLEAALRPAWDLPGSCLWTCLCLGALPGTCLGLAWDLDNNRFSSEIRAMMRVRVRVTVQRQRLSQ